MITDRNSDLGFIAWFDSIHEIKPKEHKFPYGNNFFNRFIIPFKIQYMAILLGFWLDYVIELDKNFRDQERTSVHSQCTYKSTNGADGDFFLRFWLQFEFNSSFIFFWGGVVRIAGVSVGLVWSYAL